MDNKKSPEESGEVDLDDLLKETGDKIELDDDPEPIPIPESIEKLRASRKIQKFRTVMTTLWESPLKKDETMTARKDHISVSIRHFICDNIYIITTKDEEELMYYYDIDKSAYIPNGRIILKDLIRKILPPASIRFVNEIIDKIRTSTYKDRSLFNPPHLIGFLNKVLDINTWEFHEPSPDFYLTNTIPVTYDPTKDCPLIQKFLNEVLPDEDDQILCLEIDGSMLLNDYRFQKAFLLVGEGNNGKTVFLNLTRALLGSHNTSAHSLQQLSKDGFSAIDLFGKKANICGDISSKDLKETSLFKKLTGGDPMTHRALYKGGITFVNIAILLFSCNKLPAIYEDTNAIWRRLCLIEFPVTISNENIDKTLIDKLTTPDELSGFLNLVLMRLKKLIKRGRHHNIKSIMDTRRSYLEKSDLVHSFTDNCVVYARKKFISSNSLYRAMCKYANAIGAGYTSKKMLATRLPFYIPEAELGKNNRNVRGWTNIELIPDLDQFCMELSAERISK